MRTGLLALFIGLLWAGGDGRAQEPTITAVATVKQLCEGIVTTSSNAIFNVGREAPSSDDDWAVMKNHALMLAESGNLFMIGGRVRDTDEWMTMSQDLVDAGVSALRAVEARDVDALLAAGDQLVVVCETCHEPYRDGGESMPIR